ncbi:MAG: M56 family metallopeptidase [bacterium]
MADLLDASSKVGASSSGPLTPVTTSAGVARRLGTRGITVVDAVHGVAAVAENGEHAFTRLEAWAAPWDVALAGAWLICSTLLSIMYALGAATIRRASQSAEPVVVDGTSVLLTESLGPAALSGRRQEVLLPRWVLALDPALRTLVLRHEREHLEARDPAVVRLAVVTVILFPWHVPLWWALQRLRSAVEIDCDSRVISEYPDVRRYAQLLLLVAQRTSGTQLHDRYSPVAALPLRSSGSTLKKRIDVMTGSRPTRGIRRVSLWLSAGTLALIVGIAPRPVRTAQASSLSPARGVQRAPEARMMAARPRQGAAATGLSVRASGGTGAAVRLAPHRVGQVQHPSSSDNVLVDRQPLVPGKRISSTLGLLTPLESVGSVAAAPATFQSRDSLTCGKQGPFGAAATAVVQPIVQRHFPEQLGSTAGARLLVLVFDPSGSLVGQAVASALPHYVLETAGDSAKRAGSRSARVGLIDGLHNDGSSSWWSAKIGSGQCNSNIRAGTFRWPADFQASGSIPAAPTALGKYEFFDFDAGVIGANVTQVALLTLKRS